jgi:hypothetical protein
MFRNMIVEKVVVVPHCKIIPPGLKVGAAAGWRVAFEQSG